MTRTKWRSKAAVAVLAGLILMAGVADAPAEVVEDGEDLTVRSTDSSVAAVIERATRESATFRAMVDTIRAAHGIVYVQPGKCGHGVRSCLVDVVQAGERRMLWVKVDVRKTDRALMASIGHELRHAIEVLADPSIKSGPAMVHFYLRTATMGAGRAFETPGAILAGDRVHAEIGEFRKREGER